MSVSGNLNGTTNGVQNGSENGDLNGEVLSVTATGVDGSSTGTTTVGSIRASAVTHPTQAIEVTPSGLDGNVGYNVEVNGSDLLSAGDTRTSSNNAVDLTPDQEKQVTGVTTYEYIVDVSSSAATTGTLDVTVTGLNT